MTLTTSSNQSALLPIEEWVFSQGEALKTTSKIIAKVFEKKHKIVIRDIHELMAKDATFAGHNFIPVMETMTYLDKNGVEQQKQTQRTSHYELTFDGFIMLVMGYHGDKAFQVKLRYIEAFNQMRTMISNHNYNLIAELSRALEREALSRLMGSLAGKALRRRQSEKRYNHAQLLHLHNTLQPDLFRLLEATD